MFLVSGTRDEHIMLVLLNYAAKRLVSNGNASSVVQKVHLLVHGG